MGRETDSALATVWPTLSRSAFAIAGGSSVSIVNKRNITTFGFDEDALSITTPGEKRTTISADPDPKSVSENK